MNVLYVYRCRWCSTDTERLYPMGEQPETIDCPEGRCDGTAYKLLSRGHFMPFPGSYNHDRGDSR